jgi:hypothetical protein
MSDKYHGRLQVQQRKDHGAWRTRWVFDNETQAFRYYEGLNTFGPWRKRLIGRDGKLIHSQYPTRGV